MATIKFALGHRFGVLLLFFSVALLLSGCGAGTGEVVGKVTNKGKPVVCGTVTFLGIDGTSRVGTIQTDGTYVVKDVPVGDAKVMVDSPMPNTSTSPQGKGGRPKLGQPSDLPADAPKVDRTPTNTGPKLPADVAAKWAPVNIKYADQTKTPLKFTVRKGPNTYDIEVEP